LTGKPASDGVIKGKVTGILGGDTSATRIKDATFELRPIRDDRDWALIDPLRDALPGTY